MAAGSDAVHAVARRHGFGPDQVGETSGGVANHVYLLGDGLVLRIPRSGEFVADLRKEATVIPLARAAGVRTPGVVAFDDSRDLLDLPYLIQERVPGADLAGSAMAGEPTATAYHGLGRELAKLHRIHRAEVDIPEVPVDDERADPYELLERLLAHGWLDADAGRWFGSWFERLTPRVPAPAPMVLLHGDVAPQNILVEPRDVLLEPDRNIPGPGVLIDWGDAAWGDPAMEFAKLPLPDLAAVLAGYRHERGEAGTDGEWEARALWYHLVWGLGRLADPVPAPRAGHWTAPPVSRLLGVLRFFAADPPHPWPGLG